MKRKGIVFISFLLIIFSSCAKKIIPDRPDLVKTDFKLDSLPDSEFNIPIQVYLKPVFSLAEKSIDTVFTSPNWPNDWVSEDCTTRYKYHFRRGPLQFKASGLSLNLGFTGYYQIIGSTRVCVGGTVISPWTPGCRCGFEEGERKVNIAFNNSLFIQPDYKIRLSIQRLEPVPQDKCNVCFWGQDITAVVMKGLKSELDASKKAIIDSFGVVDLKPRFQDMWNKLNTPFNIYGLGWLQINPRHIRINNVYAKNDSLNIYLGLSARPVISFEKGAAQQTKVPDIADFSQRTGFSIFLDAVLNYDSLSNLVNSQLKNKQFDFSKGPVKKIFIIKQCRIYGDDNEKLIIKVSFGGTDEGVAYFTGKPSYNIQTKTIEIKNLDFDVKTRDLLVKSAGWLFNRRILTELQKFSKFELGSYIDTAKLTINKQLNRELIKGIRSYGNINDIRLIGIYPLREHIIIRSNCSGDLAVKVEAVSMSL